MSPDADNIPRDALSLGLNLPAHFMVSVIMESRPAKSPWIDRTWHAIGVTVGADSKEPAQGKIIHENAGVTRYLYSGFKVELFRDECERYYHNLMSPTPCCFVIATKTDDAPPRPYKVTLDFDEAHAYEEGDEWVYSVAIPAELYQWCEAFTLQHYVQEKRYKRKLKDWSAREADSRES